MALIACKLFNSHTILPCQFLFRHCICMTKIRSITEMQHLSYHMWHEHSICSGSWNYCKFVSSSILFLFPWITISSLMRSPRYLLLWGPPNIFLSCFYQIFTRSAVWPRHRLVGTLLPHLGKKYNFDRKEMWFWRERNIIPIGQNYYFNGKEI